MKTRYDWFPGERGKLLAPDGPKSDSIRQTVVADMHVSGEVLRLLYLDDRLVGQALVDASAKYGAEP